MAEPQQQSKPPAPEFLLDDADLLTAEDKAALAAEEAGEPEPPPEGLPAKQPEQPTQQVTPEAAPAKREPPKTIPYNRFKEVNDRAKALEAEAQALRDERSRLDERLKMAREADERARQQPQEPVEVPSKLGARPDPAIDPIGADLWDVKRENEMVRFQLEQTQRGLGETGQQIQQSREQQQFANWVNDDAQRFRAQHPDYDAAADHVYKFRVQYWQSAGLSEPQAKQIVDQEAVATAMLARQNGKSASEMFYGLAQQVGYQGNGAQPTVAAEPEVQPSPTQQARERLNQVREGQKFQGLSRVPAENPANVDWTAMGAQEIANIPEEDFVEMINDPVRGPQLRKAMQRLELGQ